MSCRLPISLATKGIICKGGDGSTVIVNQRCVLPFKIQLKRDKFTLDFKELRRLNLSSNFRQKSFNIKISDIKLNRKFVNNLKIRLNRCEE